jgi:mersacidin/lichenicidin family type 2 lantibiotic
MAFSRNMERRWSFIFWNFSLRNLCVLSASAVYMFFHFLLRQKRSVELDATENKMYCAEFTWQRIMSRVRRLRAFAQCNAQAFAALAGALIITTCFYGLTQQETSMSKIDIVRAWKDEEYRSSLSEAQRAELPDNPAGLIELSESDLRDVAGGTITPILITITVCPTFDYCSNITVCPSVNYCPVDVVQN